MRFIRKNGRIIPIRDKKPSADSGPTVEKTIRYRERGIGERAYGGAKTGATIGATLFGGLATAASVMRKDSPLNAAKFVSKIAARKAFNWGIGGAALGAVFGSRKKVLYQSEKRFGSKK